MRRDDLRALDEAARDHHSTMLQYNDKITNEEKRSFTAEETQEFERMEKEFDDLNERRDRAKKLFAQDQVLQQDLNTPIEMRTGVQNALPASFAEYRDRNRDKPWGADQPEVRSALYKYWVHGWQQLDIEEQRALSRATGAAGNFLVPTEIADGIIRAERFMGGIADLTKVITTESGETINYPTNLAHGTATWTAENAALTPSDETFGQVALGANKLTTKIIVSAELLQDSGFPLDAYLIQEFGERIAVVKEAALINGSGTGQPQGIATVGGGVPVYTAAVGNTTTYNYTALVTGIFTLPAQYRRNASFLVADGSARNLYLMVDGQSRPLWSVNVASNGPDTFLGYPIRTHPDLAAPAVSSKDVLFGDFNRTYVTRVVRGYQVQRQDELHSDNDQVGFRAATRIDGRVVNPNASLVFAHSAT